MTEIRKLTLEEISSFIDIVTNAYTGIMENTKDSKERLINYYKDTQENNNTVQLYGAFRNGKLIGGMRLHSFEMNYENKKVKVGGVGLVAVDLLHKKEKVAKDLITYFIKTNEEANIPILALYPFRPDFYLKMGFGYGTKMNQYHILPDALASEGKKEHIRFVGNEESEQLFNCFNTFASRQHGMMYKQSFEMNRLLNDPGKRVIAFYKDQVLDSYMSFTFKKMSDTNFCLNNLVIDEMIYNSPEGLLALQSFLQSQGDQVNRIVLNTQDESFYHVLQDPRNHTNEMIPSVYHESHTSGVGIMYRMNDVSQLLEGKYVEAQACNVKISVIDMFMKETQELYLSVKEGQLFMSKHEEGEIQVTLDMASFSSLLMGSVDFSALYRYGKVQISAPLHVEVLSSIFKMDSKPICMTLF
ncbi:GNAT family N-acetyltransferase [Bacillus suaedaesalsae]|uniref:GNAT family N-acetyltransferase n=1 Tax=Bacillus suaedaesalsae TaxID=2810349 RepID=A0ABS2DPF0_9BACI|nr:GNAT family N-acetyltransferase [Bacillus suaedaesalsae]MBM6619543.1 GNAT family N-acetyltransferase [Bacillus suaedaesalsae]